MLQSLGVKQTWPKASAFLLQATTSPGSQKPVYIGGELTSLSSIRLLKIQSPTHEETSITCTVQPFELDEKLTYYALSYTWGPAIRPIGPEYELPSPDEPQQILCNDQPLLVTQNLHDALLELRQSGFPNWLWVDAVCIDQSNADERARQVSMMGQIYMSSVETVAWLGKDESGAEDIEWAIDVMIPKMLQRAPDFWDIRPLTDIELETIFGVEDLNQRLSNIKIFLAAHRWFDRAWVAQEIALAPAVRIQVGRRQISWTDLTNLSIILSRRTWNNELASKSPELDEGYSAARAFLEKLRGLRDLMPHKIPCQPSRQAPERLDIEKFLRATFGPETELEVAAAWLAHLLSLVRHLKSSEMHDKIYSIIGVANVFSSKIGSLVTPDYDQSPEMNYTSTTAALLLNSRYLSILAHVGDLSNTRLAELPSWAVDYSSRTATNPILEFGKGQATSFDASLTSKLPPVPRIIEGTRLTLAGAVFDHVTMVSAATLGEIVEDFAHLEDFEKFISHLPDQYFNGESRTDVIWRVMMMDSEETLKCINHPAPSSFAQGFRAWVINMIGLWVADVVKTGVELDSANESARQFFAQLYPNDSIQVPEEFQGSEEAFTSYHRRQMLPFIHAVESKVYGRKLFQTTGNLLGMGSRSVQADDQVWLIRDSKTPLILRPKPGTEDFLLVGEAYLHGFMHGEMLDDVGKLEDRIGPVTIV
jgi:Heterokaryon incompatibility protein (HET)